MMSVLTMPEQSIYGNMNISHTSQSHHHQTQQQQQQQQYQQHQQSQHQQQPRPPHNQHNGDRADGQRYSNGYSQQAYPSATSQSGTQPVSSAYYHPSMNLASAAFGFDGNQQNGGDYAAGKTMPSEYSFASASVPYPTPGIEGASSAQQWLGNKRPLPTPMQNQSLPSLSATFGMDGPSYQAPTHTNSFSGVSSNANFGGLSPAINTFGSTSAMTSAAMNWVGSKPYSYPSAAYPYSAMQMQAFPAIGHRMSGYSYRLPLHDRPFKCDQCVQSFNRNHDLKRHRRIHLAVKPFPCAHCDKSFSRKDALKRHVLVKGCGGKGGTQLSSNSLSEPKSSESPDESASDGQLYMQSDVAHSLQPLDQSTACGSNGAIHSSYASDQSYQ